MDINLQEKNEVTKEFGLSYKDRKLDICGICKLKYNVGDRIPRILVNCGHTYCTSCLSYYYHEETQRIRCPFCKKLVKHLVSIENLTLNIPIFSEIVRNDEKLLHYIKTDNNDELMVDYCEKHSRRKHFYCSFHNINFCRECIRQFHKDDRCCVVDLSDIQKIYSLNEQSIRRNEQIFQMRNKYKGKMHKDEFFISNYN